MIKIIAAIGKNNELGKDGRLLWNLAADLKNFKNLTDGQTVAMGRKTFESLPPKFRPLPNRKNIVLTRDKTWSHENVETVSDFSELKDAWIIGGGEIYKQFINIAAELHITHVDGDFEADTHFPEIDLVVWKKVSEESQEKNEKNSHNFIYTVYKKI